MCEIVQSSNPQRESVVCSKKRGVGSSLKGVDDRDSSTYCRLKAQSCSRLLPARNIGAVGYAILFTYNSHEEPHRKSAITCGRYLDRSALFAVTTWEQEAVTTIPLADFKES